MFNSAKKYNLDFETEGKYFDQVNLISKSCAAQYFLCEEFIFINLKYLKNNTELKFN